MQLPYSPTPANWGGDKAPVLKPHYHAVLCYIHDTHAEGNTASILEAPPTRCLFTCEESVSIYVRYLVKSLYSPDFFRLGTYFRVVLRDSHSRVILRDSRSRVIIRDFRMTLNLSTTPHLMQPSKQYPALLFFLFRFIYSFIFHNLD